MPATPFELSIVPPPAVSRPVRWPIGLVAAAAVLFVLGTRFAETSWLGSGVMFAAFFVGHRFGGRWMALTAAALVLAAWVVWSPVPSLAAGLFLGALGVWGVLRFADDPAPFNGIVAGVALIALVMMNQLGAIGLLVAAGVLSIRFRSLRRIWPWVAGAALGWWLAKKSAWF